MLAWIERPKNGKDKQVVVFLHGFGGCAAQWDAMQKSIAPHCHTIAFDLPGHAGSLGHPDFGPPKVAAKAVIAELTNRGFSEWHLVGHSMGGAVSSLIALFAPDHVKSLTLLAPGGFGPEIDDVSLAEWSKAKTAADFQALLPRFFADGYSIPAEMIDMHVAQRQQDEAIEALQSIADQVFENGRQGRLPLDAVIGGAYPVTLIWGTQDTIIPVSQARSLQDNADRGELELIIVEGMGHMPAEEAPELVEKVILGNLKADGHCA